MLFKSKSGGETRQTMKLISSKKMLLALLMSFAVVVSACGDKAQNSGSGGDSASKDTAQERVLTDALGNEVKVPAHPQRIIATYLEDHLLTLGVKPVAQWSIKGDGVQNYLQDQLAEIPKIPYDLPYESVMSFEPDLIILGGADMAADGKYEQYSKIAPTYVVGKEKSNNWREELKAVGEVLGKTKEAEEAIQAYDQKAAEAREKLKQVIGSRTAASLWVTEKAIFVVSDHLSSGTVLYNDLGLAEPKTVEEISKTGTANWNSISMEEFAQMDADYLFIVNNRGVTKEQLMKDPIWANIPAVKENHVYEFDDQSSWLYAGAIANSKMIDDVLSSVVQ